MASYQAETLALSLLSEDLTAARLKALQKLAFGNSQNKSLLVSNSALEIVDKYYKKSASEKQHLLRNDYLGIVRALCVNNRPGRERIWSNKSDEFDVVRTVVEIMVSSKQDFADAENAVTTLCAVLMNSDGNCQTAAEILFADGADVVRDMRSLYIDSTTTEGGSEVGEFRKKLDFIDALVLPLFPNKPSVVFKLATKEEATSFKGGNTIQSGLDLADKFIHLSDRKSAGFVYKSFFESDHPNCPVIELNSSKLPDKWIYTRKVGDPVEFVVSEKGKQYSKGVHYAIEDGCVHVYNEGEGLVYCDVVNRDGGFISSDGQPSFE